MDEVMEQLGSTLYQLVLFLLVIGLIFVGAFFGGKGIFRQVGETTTESLETDGFTTASGTYEDTERSIALAGKTPEIILLQQPNVRESISYTALFEVKEDGTTQPFTIVSVKNIQGEDAIKAGCVSQDKEHQTIQFLKKGSYVVRLRINGTAITKKNYMITIK